MSGALVNSPGRTIRLEDAEQCALRAHLKILRSKNAATLRAVIYSAISNFRRNEANDWREEFGWKQALASVIREFATDGFLDDGASDGAIVDILGNRVEELLEHEMKVLQDTLVAIRAGGWFADWLELQVASIASSDEPDVCYPAPLKIMETLTEAIDEFETQAEATREMIRMRPDLFAPKPKAPIRVVKTTAEAKSRAHRKRRKAA